MFAVASSSTTTFDLRKTALIMQTSCFWPELKLLPFSCTLKSSGESSVFNLSAAYSTKLRSLLSSYSEAGSKFSLRVPLKRVGSYAITVSADLKRERGISEISLSSIKI